MATLCFLMRCDGDFSQEEREWLEDGLDYLKLDGGLPDDVKAKVQAIADDEDLSFDRVKDCLDNVSIVSLGSIAEQLQVAAASPSPSSPGVWASTGSACGASSTGSAPCAPTSSCGCAPGSRWDSA